VGDDAVSIVVDEPTLEPTYSPTPEPSSPPTIPQSEKPHVVFILADDLGWNSMGYQEYDLTFATPTLSAMAAKGIIMDSYYAQEVCTPSRASLLTGRYPLSVGMQYSIIMPTTSWGLHIDETTIADVLNSEGYHTHMLGKWHLGHFDPRLLPTARGFSSFTGYLCGESYYW
jgi:arylsulfatase A-like enzyme